MVILRFVIVSLSIHPKQKNLCHRNIIHHSLDNKVVVTISAVSWWVSFLLTYWIKDNTRVIYTSIVYEYLHFIINHYHRSKYQTEWNVETCWLNIYSASDHVKGWQFSKITKYSFSTFCGFTLHVNRVPTTNMNNLCYWYFSSMSKNQKHMC